MISQIGGADPQSPRWLVGCCGPPAPELTSTGSLSRAGGQHTPPYPFTAGGAPSFLHSSRPALLHGFADLTADCLQCLAAPSARQTFPCRGCQHQRRPGQDPKARLAFLNRGLTGQFPSQNSTLPPKQPQTPPYQGGSLPKTCPAPQVPILRARSMT